MRLFDDIIINGNRAVCRSYAKINLTLDVVGRRDNGYHDVSMIMQTVNLSDNITVDRIKNGIFIKTNLNFLPTDSRNIAYAAAELFFEESKISGGAKINIYKNIPVAAGLAGGSGNAAAVLCALNKLYGCPLSWERISQISVKLGADVPYCIMGGTALAEGIGDELTELPAVPKMTVLLVKPPISVSTPYVYGEYDKLENCVHYDTEQMVSSLGNIYEISENLFNTLEQVTIKKYPVISGIKNKMLSDGALGALMSGSGPSVFGIFDDYNKAKKSADDFFRQFREVYLCNTLN